MLYRFLFACMMLLVSARGVAAQVAAIDCERTPFAYVSRAVMELHGVLDKADYLARVAADAQGVTVRKKDIIINVVVSNCADGGGESVGLTTRRSNQGMKACVLARTRRCVLLFASIAFLKSADELALDWVGRDYVCRAIRPYGGGQSASAYWDWRVETNRCRLRIARAVEDYAHAQWLDLLVPPDSPQPAGNLGIVRR